jgi:IS5 family transposase
MHFEAKNVGGRRLHDYILMMEILILQHYYIISDDQAEYQICERLSFMRFLGLP